MPRNTLPATYFIGSGSGLSALNASNNTPGTLSISQGGIGVTTLCCRFLISVWGSPCLK